MKMTHTVSVTRSMSLPSYTINFKYKNVTQSALFFRYKNVYKNVTQNASFSAYKNVTQSALFFQSKNVPPPPPISKIH